MPRRPSVPSALARLRDDGLAGESAWSLLLEATTMIGTLLAFTLLGRSLGVAGYGGYAALYAIVGPMVTLSGSAVTMVLLQYVVRDEEPLDATARSCLTMTLGLGTLLTATGFAIATFVIRDMGRPAMLALLAIELLTTPTVNVAAAAVQAAINFSGAARIRILLVLGRIVLLIVLYAAGHLSVATLGLTQLTWSGVLALGSLWVVGQRFDFSFAPGRLRRGHLRTNLNYSLAISADAFGNDGDKTVLAANRYQVQTGLYSAAYRIVALGLVPLGSLVNVSHTRFLQRQRQDERAKFVRQAGRYSIIGGTYGVAFAVGVWVLAPVFPRVVGADFEGSVNMVRWLSPIVFLRAVGTFSMNGLMGLGRVTLRTVLITLNALFGMVLYILLIPSMGWRGALIGTLVTEALQVVMTWTALIIVQRRVDKAMDAEHAPDLSGAAP